ncbi:MAG: FG-GAP repeat domain-containing protein, partial [Candidatus Hinthialibacter sp.]
TQTYTELASIEAQFGLANIAMDDFNGDGLMDLYALNVIQETLDVYTGDGSGGYALSASLDVSDEQIPDIYNLDNGVRYRSLAVGRINGDEKADAVIRGRQTILIASASDDGQLHIDQRIELDGASRFIHGGDLDGDGDLDFLVGMRASSGQQQICIFKSDDGQVSLSQTLRTDFELDGNNPLQTVFHDWNADGLPDLNALVFTGVVQRYINSPDGRFTRIDDIVALPLGEVLAVDLPDLDSDGVPELIGLHRSQEGLALIVVCCEDYAQQKSFLITKDAPKGERYALHCMDVDLDGDPDVLFTRSYHDDLVWMVNGVN